MGILNKLLGITECGSVHGELVDNLLELVHWFMLFLGIGWTVFVAYALWRFNRRNNPKADYAGVESHASSHIEVGVIVTEVILLLGFAFPLWGQQTDDIPTDADVQVRAIAQQYNWTFHYAGADGRFGNTDPRNYSSSNNAGIDPDDPNGKDDVVVSELWVPLDKKIVIGVTSKDVIHNLALVRARVTTDAVPGQLNRIWFIPTLVGQSEIICGQLCGPGHGVMKGLMNIVPEKDYSAWFKEQNTFGGSAPAAAAPAPPAAPAAAAPAPAPAAAQ
jgi:cytochrome c oxidase subunit 2